MSLTSITVTEPAARTTSRSSGSRALRLRGIVVQVFAEQRAELLHDLLHPRAAHGFLGAAERA
jgi:hypothetical protein